MPSRSSPPRPPGIRRCTLAALGLAAPLAILPVRGGSAYVRQVRDEQASRPLDAVFECYRRAGDETLLDEADVANLCEGASDASPVECFLEARGRTFVSTPDAIALCRCATGAEPVECLRRGAETTTLDPRRILALCSPVERLHLASDCSPER